jgi:hypothetical protein
VHGAGEKRAADSRKLHELSISPFHWQLRVDQFFSDGFVERKIILVHDVLKLCQMRHIELKRNSKAAAAKAGSRPAARPVVTPVVRHRPVSTSLSGSSSFFDSHSMIGTENEERGLPRTAAPPAPTPTPVQPAPRAQTAPSSSILEARASAPQPLVINGGMPSRPSVQQGGVYGEIDEVDYDYDDDDDDNEGGGYAEYGYGQEGDDEYGDDDELFVDRQTLARQQQQQQQQRQQQQSRHSVLEPRQQLQQQQQQQAKLQGQQNYHHGLSGCHNDQLVLKLSESIMHIDARQQLLEGRCRALEEALLNQGSRAGASASATEEALARLTIAEGKLRMMEQRVNEVVADQAVQRAFSPMSKSPDMEALSQPPAPSRLHFVGDAHEGSNSHQNHVENTNINRQQPLASAKVGQSGLPAQSSPMRGSSRSDDTGAGGGGRRGPSSSSMFASLRGVGDSAGGKGAAGFSEAGSSTRSAGELDGFIASIAQRFKQTNDLLMQSKASLAKPAHAL